MSKYDLKNKHPLVYMEKKIPQFSSRNSWNYFVSQLMLESIRIGLCYNKNDIATIIQTLLRSFLKVKALKDEQKEEHLIPES